MRHVQVSRIDHRFFLFQLLKIRQEIRFPLHAVFQSRQFSLGVRYIDCHKIELRILCSDHPALMVVFLHADAVSHLYGLFLCKNCSAGIALFLCVIPILMISGQIQCDLSLLQFCLLQAENICIRFLKEIQESLLHAGSQPVHIP